MCILYDGFDKKMSHSLKAVENLAKENGVEVFNNLEDTAKYINEFLNYVERVYDFEPKVYPG